MFGHDSTIVIVIIMKPPWKQVIIAIIGGGLGVGRKVGRLSLVQAGHNGGNLSGHRACMQDQVSKGPQFIR